MIIGIDAMGGDNAPRAILNGVQLALKNGLQKDEIYLYGDENVLQMQLFDKIEKFNNVKIIHCSESIEGEDKPVMAIRKKKDSSIVKGARELKEGKIDAFLSAGNTGAVLAAGTLVTGRIKGIKRPALTTVYPTEKGFSILCDIGANAECTPENIECFAIMGSLYAKEILGIENPTVALLNIGTEENKGNDVYIKAHQLLKNNLQVNFKGNIESKDLLKGDIDLVVCDGFTGNIALKLIEGAGSSLMNMVKKSILSSFTSKIGGMLIKSSLKEMKENLNPSKYGGAPLLGTKYPVIKAHGSSDDVAIMNAILYAKKYVESDLISKLKKAIKEAENEKEDETINKKEEKTKEQTKK